MPEQMSSERNEFLRRHQATHIQSAQSGNHGQLGGRPRQRGLQTTTVCGSFLVGAIVFGAIISLQHAPIEQLLVPVLFFGTFALGMIAFFRKVF